MWQVRFTDLHRIIAYQTVTCSLAVSKNSRNKFLLANQCVPMALYILVLQIHITEKWDKIYCHFTWPIIPSERVISPDLA